MPEPVTKRYAVDLNRDRIADVLEITYPRQPQATAGKVSGRSAFYNVSAAITYTEEKGGKWREILIGYSDFPPRCSPPPKDRLLFPFYFTDRRLRFCSDDGKVCLSRKDTFLPSKAGAKELKTRGFLVVVTMDLPMFEELSPDGPPSSEDPLQVTVWPVDAIIEGCFVMRLNHLTPPGSE